MSSPLLSSKARPPADRKATETALKQKPYSRLSWLIVSGAALAASYYLWSRNPQDNQYALCSNNANIYTVDNFQPQVECMLVRNGRIQLTGSREQIQKAGPRLLQVHQLKPEWIAVPGLSDAHAHIMENGYMKQLPLVGSTSITDIISRVKQFILDHPEIENDRTRWVEGMGWDQTKWAGAAFPTADDLDIDPVLRGRPILLRRVDGHAIWVSPRALELAGPLPEEVDGGLIVRDKNGQPTGVFVDNAMSLINPPEWSNSQRELYFKTSMAEALMYGLTSIHDAATLPDDLSFIQKKAEIGQLPLRVYAMASSPATEYWGGSVPRLIDFGLHHRLTVRSVKLFADGALGSWGAALLEPYTDKPSTRGLMLSSPEDLSTFVHRFWQDGLQVNIHCIGDRANHVVLDIFEELLSSEEFLAKANASTWRPRIEHAQIMTASDLQRVGALGVIPSVQPTHATSDMWYAETRLGSERIKGAYAYQTLLRSSQTGSLPLGSDFPVEHVNPLFGFYAAVSRLSTDGTSPHGDGGWYTAERLTRLQALKGMTLDAAYASFTENELGSITPGKKADFVILDKNIMTVPFADILETKVVATVVDGVVAYGHLI